uniref:Uncharacterized protein n=1 Tax=Amphimedon queenslandica TaxID=400682 RepID=A0A1X7TEM4_AMPQE
VCSCGSCNNKSNLNCAGKAYKTGNILDCPFHLLARELEVERKQLWQTY